MELQGKMYDFNHTCIFISYILEKKVGCMKISKINKLNIESVSLLSRLSNYSPYIYFFTNI